MIEVIGLPARKLERAGSQQIAAFTSAWRPKEALFQVIFW
jgi:hypothetical protein